MQTGRKPVKKLSGADCGVAAVRGIGYPMVVVFGLEGRPIMRDTSQIVAELRNPPGWTRRHVSDLNAASPQRLDHSSVEYFVARIAARRGGSDP